MLTDRNGRSFAWSAPAIERGLVVVEEYRRPVIEIIGRDEKRGRDEALHILPVAGELPGPHRAEPEGHRAGGQLPAPRKGRSVRRRIPGDQPADGGADLD